VAAVVGACAAVLSAVLVAVLLSGNEDGGTAADGGAPAGAASQASDAPLDVVVRPHTLDPCEMAFLVDQEPATVPPPPMDTNATGWVNALGAVAAGRQAVEVTVQGTGDQPVVLNALRVHVTEAGEPLPWNLYGGYSACGGGPVDTAGFDVDLDAGAPEAVAGAGQDAFPLWVDATEPMVLYVAAHTEDKDVSWYLELEWSSGDRHGALRVDDEGRPFRTSATGGRTPWTYLVGGTEWLDGETLNPVG
jgi:hypothetical protein